MNTTKADVEALQRLQQKLLDSLHDVSSVEALPSPDAIKTAEAAIIKKLPTHGHGVRGTIDNLEALAQGFNQASRSPNYYGFVTGGATPIARTADAMAMAYDQNVQVHLPSETVATTVEAHALRMLCELLNLSPQTFSHMTFTTGATASNVLGLACGREAVIASAAARRGSSASVGRSGIRRAMEQAGLDDIQVLTSVPHSSLAKAASIVGLGRESVMSIPRDDSPHRIDLDKLASMLQKPRTASIVAISCGEVNTGFFATDGEDMKRIRSLCDEHGAFIHVDGAFGLMVRCLVNHTDDNDERINGLEQILAGCEGIELADSITGDAHKLLNVPYDCGFFLSRSVSLATSVFQNAGAAYLNAPAASEPSTSFIPSPLNIGLENSRRFRALPVYASLVAHGRAGHAAMLLRQIDLARAVARDVAASEAYELLPRGHHEASGFGDVYMVVLFRAKDDRLNEELVRRVNHTRTIYVSGTKWEGQPAARIAVSNWQAEPDRDAAVTRGVLREVYEQWALAAQ